MSTTVTSTVARSFTIVATESDTAFANVLGFRAITAHGEVGPDTLVFSQPDVVVGQSFDLGAFAAGTSLEFFILQNGGTLLTGDSHAQVAAMSGGITAISFEDLTADAATNPFGYRTDNDFNDLRFQVSEGASLAGRSVVLAPAGQGMTVSIGSTDSHFENALGYRVVNADGSVGADVVLFDGSHSSSVRTYDIPAFDKGTAVEFFILQDGEVLLTGDAHALRSANADGSIDFGFEDLQADAALNPCGWGTDSDFNDLTITIDFHATPSAVIGVTELAGTAAQVVRLYDAALARAPDQGGLNFYVDQLEHGRSLADIALGFNNSPEFQSRFGAGMGDDQYVVQLYQNVLHRDAAESELAYYHDQFAAGQSREQTLVGFSESPEHQALTASNITSETQFGIAFA